jgi:hypothetical protein
VGSGRAGFDFTKLGSTGNVLSIQNAAWIIGGTGKSKSNTHAYSLLLGEDDQEYLSTIAVASGK